MVQGLRLKQERENINFLSQKLGESIVQSIAYVEHNGKSYHVLKHGTSRTLEDVMRTGSPEEKLKCMEEAARLLAEIHKSRIPEPVLATEDSYYHNRLLSCFFEQLANNQSCKQIPSSLRNEISSLGERIQKELADAPTGWYKDANLRNWLVEDNWRVVAIDFEHRVMLPVHLDLVSMLEFDPVPAPNEIKDRVINYYVDEFYPKCRYSMEKFIHHYTIAALQRHLEIAGYRARDRNTKGIMFHLGRARAYAYKIGEKTFAEKLGQIVIS